MKKFIIGGIVVVLLGGYALWSASRSQTPAPVSSASSETTNPNNGSTGSSSGTQVALSGMYKDGTYTGGIGDAAPYGSVQVSVVVSNGKIASIQMLQEPQGPDHTNQIAAYAFPMLIQEAIQAQTAKVNIVSGATQDSKGFEQSLSSALVQAQA